MNRRKGFSVVCLALLFVLFATLPLATVKDVLDRLGLTPNAALRFPQPFTM
jgi:hypothetical protein